MVSITLDNTIGAAFLGTVFAALLYGITNVQTYIYYTNYHRDRLFHKYAVALLWILDTIHFSLTVAVAYHYLIKSFGQEAALGLVDWSFKLQIAVNVVIVLVVQTLYAARVWRLGRHNKPLLPIIVSVVLVAGYVVGVLLALKTYSIGQFSQLQSLAWVIYAAFTGATFVDFVIAGVMCYYLVTSKSSFASTNSKIMMVIRMTIVTGCLTSACSLVCLICFAIMPDNLVFIGIEFLLTKLYVNSFLAMLNARQSDNGDGITATGSTQSVSIGRFNIRTTTTTHIATSGPDSAIPLTPLSPIGPHPVKLSKLEDPSEVYPIINYKNDSYPSTPTRSKTESPV